MSQTAPVHNGCTGELTWKDGAIKCLGCETLWITNQEKHAFYELHRFPIQDDIKRLGRSKTLNRWHIPGGSLSRLLARWSKNGKPAPLPADPPRVAVDIPELPAFSDKWDPKVQLKWLEVRLAIQVLNRKEV